MNVSRLAMLGAVVVCLCGVLVRASDARFADALVPAAGREEGKALTGLNLQAGEAKWQGPTSVEILPRGVTSSGGNGGTVVHAAPRIAGKYVLHAVVEPGEKGSLAVALGRAGLLTQFSREAELLVGMARGGAYEVILGGRKLRTGGASDYGGFKSGGNAIDAELDTVAERLSVRINGEFVVKSFPLDALGAYTAPRITLAGINFYGPMTPETAFVREYSLTTEALATAGLHVDHIEGLYFAPNTPTTLRWKAESVGPASDAAYQISDYVGKNVAQGVAKVSRDGLVTTEVTLSPGYYEILFPQCGERFGMMATSAGGAKSDPFFGMDAGLSWLVSSDRLRQGYVKTMAKVGISATRERLNWGGINPSPEKWNWETPGRPFDSVRKMYAQEHIGVLDMVWGQSVVLGVSKVVPYPQDLGAAERVWDAITQRWGANWMGTEIWNEPDLIAVPADQYVPAVKMVMHLYQQRNVQVPVIGGVFAKAPASYWRTCAANGLLDCSDAISFHHYDSAREMAGFVELFRKWLEQGGKPGMELWCTEAGLPWGKGYRAVIQKDAETALSIASKAFEAKAVGVARYFPFFLPPWADGNGNNFGMTDAEGTPMRSMAGYVHTMRALAGKPYRGDWEVPGASLARVFGEDDELVIAVFTGKVDRDAKVKMEGPIRRVEGIDGRDLGTGTGGVVAVPDGMGFVWLGGAAAGSIKTNTSAMTLWEIAKARAMSRTKQAPVILQNAMDLGQCRYSAQRYLFEQSKAESVTLVVKAHNLSGKPAVATLRLKLPAGKEAPGAENTVEIPAGGSAKVQWKVDLRSALDVAELRYVTVEGKLGDGQVLSPLAMPMMIEGSLETHLARQQVQDRLAINDVKAWTSALDSSGDLKIAALGQGCRFDVAFSTPTGSWLFPRLAINRKLAPAKHTGLLMRARILQPARHVGMMVRYDDQTPGFEVHDVIPADGEWHVVNVPFAEFVPEAGNPQTQNATLDVTKIGCIAVGFVSNQSDNAMEISDLMVVGSGETK